MKKTLSVLLVTVLLLTCIPLGAVSVSALVEGKYTFLLNEDEKSVTITDVDENIAGRVVIPSKLRGYPVTAIGKNTFFRCWDVTSVVIPKGVIEIGAGAFDSLNITSAELPDGLITIGDNAFYECDKLKTVNIPDTVTSIGNSAFTFCEKLTAITIPDSVTTLGNYVFQGCHSITSITIPGSIKEIPFRAFCNLSNLKSVTIKSGVEKIRSETFENCYALTEVTFPNTVTLIDQWAFSGCSSLKKIVVPGSVKSIGFRAFSYCEALTDVTLGNGIETIASRAFMNCDSLKEIAIPSSVTVIEDYLFEDCVSLTDISFGKNITTIETYAFRRCDLLSDVWFAGTKEDRGYINYSYGTEEIQGAIWHYNCYPFEIVTQPKTAYAKEGATAKTTVKATGDGLKYQWYFKNAGATKYSKSSITKSTYSAIMNDTVHGRRVYCIITDKNGNQLKTNTVLLRRQASITKQPATTVYAKKGAKATVKITAKGDGLKYTWYFKSAGASKYSKSSITSATYSTTMGSNSKNRKVYCVVKDKYGKTVKSNLFTLRESVSITTQPKTVTVKKNAKASVKVKASGDGLKYTWYIKNAGASKYSKSSVKTATYSAKMTSKVKNRSVYCVVTDKYGKTVKTVTVKLKMK